MFGGLVDAMPDVAERSILTREPASTSAGLLLLLYIIFDWLLTVQLIPDHLPARLVQPTHTVSVEAHVG